MATGTKTPAARVSAQPRTRTQAERRAATRAALLDAAISSLVEDGYAGTTTRSIARRAGVSQATQQHYFVSKHEFVLEAMREAVALVRDDVLGRIDLHDLTDPARQEALLDEIWKVHQGQAFKAALELWNAARTDAELRRAMRKLEREVRSVITATTRELLDDPALSVELRELVNLVLATVRGYAMLAPVVPPAELGRYWATARRRLVRTLREQLAGG